MKEFHRFKTPVLKHPVYDSKSLMTGGLEKGHQSQRYEKTFILLWNFLKKTLKFEF